MLPRGAFKSSLDGGPATFSLDRTLPRFPLPRLEDTLARYRRVALVFCASDEERRTLEEAIEEALADDSSARRAQRLLESRHAATDNYVDAWWSLHAYLEDRTPIVPQESAMFEFASGGSEFAVPQTMRAALIAYASGVLHASLRDETFAVLGPATSKPYAMNQFRHVYETCRIPRRGADAQRTWFATSSERAAHGLNDRAVAVRTFVLGSAGRFYELDLDDANGVPLSVGALWRLIDGAQRDSRERPRHSGEIFDLGFITGSGRDEWAQAYETITTNGGRAALDAIERAVFALSLLDAATASPAELLSEVSMSLEGGSRWYDKSTQYMVYRDGRAGCSMEHSVMDAAGQFLLHAEMERLMRAWFDDCSARSLAYETRIKAEAVASRAVPLRRVSMWPPRPLDFGVATPDLARSLLAARSNYLERRTSVWHLRVHRLRGIGKRQLGRRLGVSPDSFVQVAMQAAYYKLHGRVASTYETVGVLPFRLGRTEAGRSATLESLELCRMPVDAPRPEIARMVRLACEAHSGYVRDAADGRGIDRHIFALKCQAAEAGLEVPRVFRDELWTRASRWDLSTSHAFVDLLHAEAGGTSFRPFDPAMTGVVYAVFDDWIDLTVITCDSEKYNPDAFIAATAGEIARLVGALISTSVL